MLSGIDRPAPGRHLEGIDLGERERVVVALSGGGDSLALLFLAHDFFRHLPDPPELLAVTIDHGLRTGSAGEAETVARLCARHRIAHRTLKWEGRKPVTGISKAAREARHTLLADAACAAGTDLVLTGHTLDDQAETVSMRAMRGDAAGGHARGMAGMAPATLFDGRVWFARPLLSMRRAALRDHLRRLGICWIDDPTNEDPRYERARIRAGLDEPARIAAVAGAVAVAAEREELGRTAAHIIADHVTVETSGLLRLSSEILLRDRRAAVYALRILLAVAGGREQLADVRRTAHVLAALETGRVRTALSRTLVARGRNGIGLHRETRNLPIVGLDDGPIVWDGRYRIAAAEPEDGVTVGPAGFHAAAGIADVSATTLERTALAAQPALFRGGRYLGLARELPGIDCAPVVAPWARYMPSFDHAPACCVARLLGVAEPARPPLAGHNEAR